MGRDESIDVPGKYRMGASRRENTKKVFCWSKSFEPMQSVALVECLRSDQERIDLIEERQKALVKRLRSGFIWKRWTSTEVEWSGAHSERR